MDADRARGVIATERPRRLRLDELLEDLGAREPTGPAADGPVPDGDRAGGADSPARPETITVGELVDSAAEGGFGFLIGILSLIAIPFFGLSTPFGLAIALVGAQMMVGRSHPWLPRRARQRALSMSMLDRVAGMLARRTRWLAKSTRRRWELWIQLRLIGLGVVVLALALALPLPIPGSNMIFLIPIFIYAIGVLERDGMWIAIGHACLVVDVVLLFVFGNVVWTVLERLARWVF